MMVPNKENIRKWVDALRSGKYKQGRNVLCNLNNDDSKYCCLGVACEISPIERHEITAAFKGSVKVYGNENFSSYNIMPIDVQIWLGIDDSNPMLKNAEGEEHSAAVWNDLGGYKGLPVTFQQIADMIERKYLNG